MFAAATLTLEICLRAESSELWKACRWWVVLEAVFRAFMGGAMKKHMVQVTDFFKLRSRFDTLGLGVVKNTATAVHVTYSW